jgi:hypothetical protein
MHKEPEAPTGTPGADALEALKVRLQECVRELDRLEQHHAAALVCMAIDRLAQTSGDPASFD